MADYTRLRARAVPEPPEGNPAGAFMPEAGEGRSPDETPVPASGGVVVNLLE